MSFQKEIPPSRRYLYLNSKKMQPIRIRLFLWILLRRCDKIKTKRVRRIKAENILAKNITAVGALTNYDV